MEGRVVGWQRLPCDLMGYNHFALQIWIIRNPQHPEAEP